MPLHEILTTRCEKYDASYHPSSRIVLTKVDLQKRKWVTVKCEAQSTESVVMQCLSITKAEMENSDARRTLHRATVPLPTRTVIFMH